MIYKSVKTRKDHICNACGVIIPAESWCMYSDFKAPKYDKDDNQIGIIYLRAWYHNPPEEGELDCTELANFEI